MSGIVSRKLYMELLDSEKYFEIIRHFLAIRKV